MRTRIISGIVGFIILLSVILIGGIALNISVFLVSIIALNELSKTLKIIDVKVFNVLNYLVSFIVLIIVYYKRVDIILPLIIGYTVLLFINFVLNDNLKLRDIGINIMMVFYTIIFVNHLALFNTFKNNKYIWIVFIIAFATDTFAYFTGKLLGKRKLCPNLSPNKTIEGSIGGIIGSLISVLLFISFFNINHYIEFIIITFVCSVLSQFGDLFASKIKRIAGIKDYGTIMPGHGGILDRFDSIIVITPVVFYYISYIIIK